MRTISDSAVKQRLLLSFTVTGSESILLHSMYCMVDNEYWLLGWGLVDNVIEYE